MPFNRYDYWMEPPPEPSKRLTHWLAKIEAGWRPNSRINEMGYDNSAQFYGVYLWEFLNVLAPLLREKEAKPAS